MRKLLVLAAAFVLVLSLAPPASAGPADEADDAWLTTIQDNIQDTGTWVGSDITCKVDSYGGAITQETSLIVGKIYGQDFGLGRTECVSFTDNNYTITTTVRLQWLASSPPYWRNITGCSNSKENSSTKGVAVNPFTTVTCTYDGEPDPYLNLYHRARTCVTNTLDAEARCYNSSPWWMRRD